MVDSHDSAAEIALTKMHKRLPLFLIHFKTLPSTNQWCQENLHTLVHDYGLSSILGIRVSADQQTNGIGQIVPFSNLTGLRRRPWYQAEGNVAVTFVFTYPVSYLHHLTVVPLVAGLAVTEALSAYGVDARVKWPNDIIIDDHKVAGILCESRPYHHPNKADQVVVFIGIGVNVFKSPLPGTIVEEESSHFKPISLCEALRNARCQAHSTNTSCATNQRRDYSKFITSDAVLEDITEKLCDAVYQWKACGFQRIALRINKVLYGYGNKANIQVFQRDADTHDSNTVVGTIKGIDSVTGALIVMLLETSHYETVQHGRIRMVEPSA